ncbi:hypothetical protein [Prosthecobacter sp.]|uniref:hypothetical protein n=1 Tax=Prosthecobacter sp. TaxID=1965333 RepID=UPI003783BBED
MTAAPEVSWDDQLGEEDVDVDVEFMASVFNELLVNAKAFSRGAALKIKAYREDSRVVFELSEPKNDPVDTSTWAQPFSALCHDHYGLGLWSAKRMINACNASLTQQYLPAESCLLTKITIPTV